MYLENISLVNFKNYQSLKAEFSGQVNCFTGDNGSGKTNLLDAIYYLSLTKSALSFTDHQCIMHDESWFTITGNYLIDDKQQKVHYGVMKGKRKALKVNDADVDKLSEHIGKYPVTLISPSDGEIMQGSSEVRRRFFDGIICQLDKEYLDWLIRYNHTLKQRNALLKKLSHHQPADPTIFEIYDEILIKTGKKINDRRRAFISEFIAIFTEMYSFLADGHEDVSLTYKSDFSDENYQQMFASTFEKDRLLQRTCVGIHKDDYIFEIEGWPAKKFGSQGQQKSFVIALKLAQFDVLRIAKGFKPVLLLDDIFDKLDDKRIAHLLQLISDRKFGQIFITDARAERTRHFIKPLTVDKKLFDIKEGTLTEVKW